MPSANSSIRILLIDNYDSYTFNLYQYLTAAVACEAGAGASGASAEPVGPSFGRTRQGGQEPVVVIRNDQFTWEEFQEILPFFDGIVISPGPGRPDCPEDFGICGRILAECTIPILGVCLGHQGLASGLNAKVVKATPPMHGRTSPIYHDGQGIFKNIPSPFNAVRYHSLTVSPDFIPKELIMSAWCTSSVVNATTETTSSSLANSTSSSSSDSGEDDLVIMGFSHTSKPIWSVQFHPESICTEYGEAIVNNFCDLVSIHWNSNFSPISQFPKAIRDISVIPSPLVSTTSSLKYQVYIKPLNFIVNSESAFTTLYSKEGESKNTFWLDSAKVEKGLSRYSFMGDISGPSGCRISYDLLSKTVKTQSYLSGTDSSLILGKHDTFFAYLAHIMNESTSNSVKIIMGNNPGQLVEEKFDMPPFLGGLVGFFGYEMKSETLCSSHKGFATKSAQSIPDSSFLFTDRTIVFDHETSTMYLVALINNNDGSNGNSTKIQHAWMETTSQVLGSLTSSNTPSSVLKDAAVKRIPQVKLYHDREEYIGMIKSSLSKISDGETYEVCLTTQLSAQLRQPHPHPLQLYNHLRARNPAPYGAFLSFDDKLIVTSSSPERFLRIEKEGAITMKPIKGTVKRANRANFKGTEEEIDQENEIRRRDLAASEKNRSENLMIVDLIRNDLNQISIPNSVHVPALMIVESYATVHQLVTTVASTLRPELTAVDAVMRSFPPGSMTGAPKLRTVQIIEDLEKIPRGPYSGVLGFFSVCGQADFSVVIRTAVFDQSDSSKTNVSVGAGGAIVILSDPEEEFEEMVLKSHTVLPSLQSIYKEFFV